ncbi:MAG: site-2 protease family protein [Desulfurococcales archaeon]|nr:site-2 protease family protein [Desulfurococcales archaeon]
MNRYTILGGEIGEPASYMLALGALTIAVGRGDVLDPGFYTSGYFIGILAGFLLHEAAHRQVARRYGMYAEFIAYIPGLLLTVASTLLPIIIIAPGYVRTYTYYGYTRGVLNSVAAGPLVNIVLGLLGGIAYTITGNPWLYGFAWINGLIAVFNLLPVPPLDGEKILRGDPRLWAIMFIIAVAIYLTV